VRKGRKFIAVLQTDKFLKFNYTLIITIIIVIVVCMVGYKCSSETRLGD